MKKTLFAILITLFLTTGMFAQRGGPRGGGPGGPGGPAANGGAPPVRGTQTAGQRNPGNGLKKALELTDAQVEQIKALNETRRTTNQTIMAEIRQARQTFDELLDTATPNPTSIGNAAIAVRAAENKLKAEQATYLADLKRLLTVTQAETLDKLIAAGAPIPGIGGGPGGPGGPGGRGRGGPAQQ